MYPRNRFFGLIVILVTMAWFLPAASAFPTFMVDSWEEWETLLNSSGEQNHARPMTSNEWEAQNQLWRDHGEGKVPEVEQILEPDLYVFEGDPNNDEYPHEACLIMAWGENIPLDAEMEATAGWSYVYGVDPDLSNSTIYLTVHPPPAIVNVTFGLTDISGFQVSWSWANPADIPSSPPSTTITINTNDIPMLGMTAPSPSASGYAINAGFDITKVVSFFINETFHTTPGTFPAPPPGPGSTTKLYWNAWDEFKVLPNTGGGGGGGHVVNSKWYIKWSQPPEITPDNMIFGWDERSLFKNPPVLADDWECKDERPITDIHWWGSFIGWTQPHPPPGQMPLGFHLGIWTDVPAGVDTEYSHPGTLVWENYCESSVWNFAGYDLDPRDNPLDNEACFQFAQLLSQDEWFWQDPEGDDGTSDGSNIYWLSIAAYYSPTQNITYPWGWKTRPHNFQDDAIRITQVGNPDGTTWPGTAGFIPYTVGSVWKAGDPVELHGKTWDLAFELTTNEPGYEDDPIPGDIGGPNGLGPDGVVNIFDLVFVARNWQLVAP